MKTNSLRSMLAAALCCSFLSSVFAAAPAGWTEGLSDEVKAKAEKENRCILLFFTGSDWCPACRNLKRDVLDNETFLRFAEKELVTVWLDFPRSRKQPDPLRKTNEQLLDEMLGENASFPTTVLLDPKGKILGKVKGSMPVDVYLACLNEWKDLPPAFQAVRENRKLDLLRVFDSGLYPVLVTSVTKTPLLLYAVTEKASEEIVEAVLEGPVDVNQGDVNGMTPLLAAADMGSEAVMDLLLKAKADPNLADRNGITPLALAVRNGNLKKAKRLLEAGASVNKGFLPIRLTPLQLAVRTGGRNLAQLLLEKGADPNQTDAGGNTALHYAAALNDPGMTRLLLQAKANTSIRNKEGKTPVDLASDEQVKALLAAQPRKE